MEKVELLLTNTACVWLTDSGTITSAVFQDFEIWILSQVFSIKLNFPEELTLKL